MVSTFIVGQNIILKIIYIYIYIYNLLDCTKRTNHTLLTQMMYFMVLLGVFRSDIDLSYVFHLFHFLLLVSSPFESELLVVAN